MRASGWIMKFLFNSLCHFSNLYLRLNSKIITEICYKVLAFLQLQSIPTTSLKKLTKNKLYVSLMTKITFFAWAIHHFLYQLLFEISKIIFHSILGMLNKKIKIFLLITDKNRLY